MYENDFNKSSSFQQNTDNGTINISTNIHTLQVKDILSTINPLHDKAFRIVMSDNNFLD